MSSLLFTPGSRSKADLRKEHPGENPTRHDAMKTRCWNWLSAPLWVPLAISLLSGCGTTRDARGGRVQGAHTDAGAEVYYRWMWSCLDRLDHDIPQIIPVFQSPFQGLVGVRRMASY